MEQVENEQIVQVDEKTVDFSGLVKKIFDLQDQMKAITSQTKDLRKPIKDEIDTLNDQIKEFMIQNDVDKCDYNEEVLELNQKIKYGSLTKKSLQLALNDFFQDEVDTKECFEHIVKFLGEEDVFVLKRSKKKKSKAKK